MATKINENGEEVICIDIPYSQKVRNECLDYHYFYHYKRDRTEELKDTTAFERNNGSIETGYAKRMLLECEKEDAKIKARIDDEEKWRKIREADFLEEKKQQRAEDKRRRQIEIQIAMEEREAALNSSPKKEKMEGGGGQKGTA